MKRAEERRLVEESITEEIYWQRRPYTVCVITVKGFDGPIEGVGVSKVCWPDWFNASRGREIARGKAIHDVARQLNNVNDSAPWYKIVLGA